jgi:biopolymer transport protein ExbB
MFLTKLALLAAESSGDEGIFDQIATRWNEGGAGMYPIALAGLAGIAIIAERFFFLYAKAAINKEGFLRGLKKHIYAGDLDKAINFVSGQKPTPLTTIVKAGLMNVPKGEEEVLSALDESSLRETPKIEARTGYLAMLGCAAMLAGLLGTVNGLIGSFKAVAHVAAADEATIVAAPISEAMICTFFGLIVAIPTLVFFSILMEGKSVDCSPQNAAARARVLPRPARLPGVETRGGVRLESARCPLLN